MRPPQVRKRKWVAYSSGEELFGLPVTQFPELQRTEEEITMLDKLYRCLPACLMGCLPACLVGWAELGWAGTRSGFRCKGLACRPPAALPPHHAP